MELDQRDTLLVSGLSIIPVFALLLINYSYFGLRIPTEIGVYLFFSAVTVLCALFTTLYLRTTGDTLWAVEAGIVRWLFVAAAFTGKGIVEGLTSVDVAGSFNQILDWQFAWELPAMIGGYLIGLKLYKLITRKDGY